jgi:adenylyltransferase/sulfurtransferase
LLIYDAQACRFEIVTVAWDPDNPLSGRSPTITDLSKHRVPAGPACAAE